ncbi:hypothetical protein M9Y10_027440 [Tritrichomonas musculus]|uniref:RING-type domain-containing protein n=1 Tax=Tritrichomonas musculus TaxID=1915356 RepID=A0ABR2H4U3_9EUKA
MENNNTRILKKLVKLRENRVKKYDECSEPDDKIKLLLNNYFIFYQDLDGKTFFTQAQNLQKQKDFEYFKFVFKAMEKYTLFATYENFKNVYESWKALYYHKEKELSKSFKFIGEFSKLCYRISFSKSNIKSFLKSEANNELYFDLHLFPFICHLYVDYEEDIIQPLKIIKDRKASKEQDPTNNFYRVYAISYILKILNIAEDSDDAKLPIDDSILLLEIQTLFDKDKLDKEINFFQSGPPEIYLLTKEISSENVIKMIEYIIQNNGWNILNFIKETDSKISFYIIIAQISFKILNYLKTLLLKKENFTNLMKKDNFARLIEKCFTFFCIIAQSPSFKDYIDENFDCISFLIQFLINFYVENVLDNNLIKIVLTNDAKKLFANFILTGPPFFSFGNSRENNQKLIFELQNCIQSEEDLFLYSGYLKKMNPNEEKKDENQNIDDNSKEKKDNNDQKEKDKRLINEAIRMNYFENTDNFKPNQTDFKNNEDYFYTVLPFFIFFEADESVEPQENEGSFHKFLKEQINKKSTQIGTKIWEKYLKKRQPSNEYSYNIKIFEDEKFEKLKNRFFWYFIRFLIILDYENSKIILHIEDTNQDCKNYFIKYFILSLPKDERDIRFDSLLQFKNIKDLLRGIEKDANKYCKDMHLMYSEIRLIDENKLMDKLVVINGYLSKHLEKLRLVLNSESSGEEERKIKEKANEVLELAITQIKYKTGITSKRSILLNQMCKKIFKTFHDRLINENDEGKPNDFFIQLFTFFAYESINLIPTKIAMKKITKIIKGLNSRQTKMATVALFNFFERKRSEHVIILKILRKEEVNDEKKKVIENNSGHLYSKEKNFCNDCLIKFTTNTNHNMYQFFSCEHVFHVYDCCGNKGKDFYKECPICPKGQQKQIEKKKVREKLQQTSSFYNDYFKMKDASFQKSIESCSLKPNLQNSSICLQNPNIKNGIKYYDVSSFFENDDEISITFQDD